MDPQLQSLYAQMKARQISPEEAAKQLQLWKSRQRVGLPPGPASALPAASPSSAGNDLLETVQAELIRIASGVLKVDAREIDVDVKLHEYGFDQVTMAEFFRHVSETYGIAPELLREYPTLHGVARYLVEEFAEALRANSRTGAQATIHDTSVLAVVPQGTVSDQFRDRAIHYFKQLLSTVLKIPVHSLEAHAAMEQYGINSVLVMELTERLEKIFGSLPKTLFFEYQSIGELTTYFLECHGDQIKVLLNMAAAPATPATPATAGRQPQSLTVVHERLSEIFDVAIIGLAGRYPGADNLAQFWENLKSGRNCITEIPRERWDWRAYFDAEKGKFGSIYTRWGGFLSAVDTFDPLFFRISPAEAQHMDPQERLFIEETYAAIEDAGYTPATLAEHGTTTGRSERRIGVFVGVMNGTYSTNSRYWSIANRVSYLFDFQGPSMAVDTACSSSLSAIHLALESLYRGTCTCAIAGGVNIIVDPIHYLGLSAMTMLSSTNQCKAFGDQADGFVDGEGVGVVVLKPLFRAVQDNDHIYGVIKGSMINAGGKTNGYTVPNPRAQARVIAAALQQMGVDPRTVSYVEAHGTGTALGDPLEIAGLTQAFRQAAGTSHAQDKQFCRIGSVKSNIGHLEGAAGIAGVTKVLLQLQHHQLVPSLHSQVLNPAIDFASTPFVVQQELATWSRPQLEVDGNLREYPRIAGISSFGAGGANAHLIIEEYVAERVVDELPVPLGARSALVVLSAKNDERLKERAQRLLTMLRASGHLWGERHLVDVAYTLQVGREAMEERLALMVHSLAELEEKLAAFLAGRSAVADLYRGRAGGPGPESLQQELNIFAADEDLQGALGAWVAKGKYDRLLSLWVKGLAVDWEQLYRSGAATDGPDVAHPRRLSLPTYPFARERYWAHSLSVSGTAANAVTTRGILHPLLHHNTSDLSEQRFSSTFSGREFFLADHLVRGQKVLPAVAYLEMAREALQRAAGCLYQGYTEIRLQNVLWTRPLVVEEAPVEVEISLFPEASVQATDGSVRITYEIYSRDEGAARVMHSQGLGLLGTAADTTPLDLVALQAQCHHGGLDAKQCYEAFAAMGLDYGSGHQGLQGLYLGTGQVLAKLALPEQFRHTDDRFVLHPSLMDAALQASFALLAPSATATPASAAGPARLALPFALREINIASGCTAAMWAWVRYAGSGAGEEKTASGGVPDLDIDICDDSGVVCVRLRGFSLRVIETPGESANNIGSADHDATLLLYPHWQEQEVSRGAMAPVYARRLVLLCAPEKGSAAIRQRLETRLASVDYLDLCQDDLHNPAIEERFHTCASRLFEVIQGIINDKPSGHVLLQMVLPMQAPQQLFAGLLGLLKTASLEYPQLLCQLIEVAEDEAGDRLIEKLEENSRQPAASRIRYQGDQRQVSVWQALPPRHDGAAMPWRDRGTYLITGGAGSLGLLLAREIASKTRHATVILTGRSARPQGQFESLRTLGARIEYRAVDVTQADAVTRLIGEIQAAFGGLQGIVHSAGVLHDNFIFKKTATELHEVLAPKVKGLTNLDRASRDLDLDFFILFSSLAGAMGNPGQADYAAANAFMDVYAAYRNTLVAVNQRRGRTVSINWPVWQQGGMPMEPATAEAMRRSLGLVPLETAAGLDAFYTALASGKDQVVVLAGHTDRLRAVFLPPAAPAVPVALQATPAQKPVTLGDPSAVAPAKTVAYLTQLLASVTGLPAHRIEADAPFEQYGMDSIMAMQLTIQLEKALGPLSKTLFFEYHDIRTLSAYFLASHRDHLQAILGLDQDVLAVPAVLVVPAVPPTPPRPRPRFAALPPAPAPACADIAVIGLAGRYPQARNLDEFWENLRTGRDCITEIPAERWQHGDYFDPDKHKPGKAYSKWGGFLDDVDRFDPLFFNISPRQAEIIDPQERLFLECVWHLLENAGHTRELLRTRYQSRVGVYVGAMYQPYHAFDADLVRASAIAVSSYYSIANRVSHFFDLQGPSMAIDTACSSALVAVHMACESLRQGECRLTIAGGVNLSLHPKKYLGLSLAQMIGSHADSRSFGDGDGYIPAEGVGAVLLKPLAQAVEDGDTILALIKSSASNHSGHTHGYAVPNPNAQAQLMIDNFRKSGINPRTISYVESAANGSALGDTIEINALHKAFREFTTDQGFCTIGSVKSNIGHAEAASGMSQLTKVILQLQHGLLVPSIKAEPLNPNLSFDGSPFVLQRQLSEWQRPVLYGIGECPRRATISSFGAGGSNAHLIVEEYDGVTPGQPSPVHRLGTLRHTAAGSPGNAGPERPGRTEAPQVIVLSARSRERLPAVAEQMLAFVHQHPAYPLASLAYSLQMRREALTTRLAIVVCSRDELVQGLQEFLRIAAASAPLVSGVLATSIPMCTGDLEGTGAEIRHLLSGKAGEAIVQVFLAENSLEKLALHWTQGGHVPWEALHAGQTVHALPLPNYPFARQRYWLAEPDHEAALQPAVSPAAVDETAAAVTAESFATLSTHDQITYFLTAILSEELGLPREAIPLHQDFQDYGADSIAVLKMARGFEEIFQTRLSGREVLEYSTVASLSRYLAARLAPQTGAKVQVDVAAHRTATASHDDVLLHHLFTAQAGKTPERTAAIFQDASLTYGEIDAKSTVLARYLQQRGAGPDVCIGLCLTRSLDMLVGILGILKAGAAYVPLDPGLAEERLEHMIDDSGMRILLTHASFFPRFQALEARRPSLHWIALDSAGYDMAPGGQQQLQDSVNEHNLAYMIYTSGSTGEPKGVMISHLAAARHCEVIRERWGIDLDQRVLQFTPLTFDPSVEQIFATLSTGAVVVLADPACLAPRPFSAMLMAHQINIMNIPPAFALELLREWQHDRALLPTTLHTLITGGDVLAVETVQLWQALLQDRVTLLNAYGPTETTVTACLYNVAPLLDAVAKIPIGRPFGNRQAYIVDHDGQPAPHGVSGEIHIGGMGLARGYRRRPALTAAAFVPDPFAAMPGARLYKTGDLGQFLPDGNIAFLGRIDHQIKIRGYRIELGEIEAVLARHPAVAQAAVIATDTPDDKRLVGYVVARRAYALEPRDLQRYVRQKLPEYMLPSRFVMLEHMPLTSSGKIDRLRLPGPPQPDGQTGLPPRDERERQLAGIWEELLDVRQPGIQDDFFTMGGHSILAIRLLARIRDKFGTELPMAALLQAPTIQGLAEILRGEQQVRDFTHLVALHKGTRRPFFCVPGVGGTVFYLLKLSSLLGRDQPFYGLQARGLDGETLPYSSVEDMATHYVQAIRTVQPQGPYLLGGHSFGGLVAFEMGRQLEAMGQEIGALVLIDCPAPAALTLQRTWDVSALFLAFARILGLGLQENPHLLCQLLGDLDTDAKLALLYEEVLKLDAFPLHVDMRQFRGLFQVYFLGSMMQYVPRSKLDNTSITLLAAQEPHSETLLATDAFTGLTNNPKLLQKLTEISTAWAEYDGELRRLWATDVSLGWGQFASRPVEVRRVSGNHMDMLDAPHVQVLATVLKAVIEEQARAAAPRPQSLVTAPYPLSKVQEGLWLLQKFSPHMSAYNVPIAIRFTQGFDVDIFRQTCAFLLDQYPILGSRFTEVDGVPQQSIPTAPQLSFQHEVLDDVDECDLIAFLSARVKQPFDLERQPLLRVHLLSRHHGRGQEHIALITIHHIVFDGTSSILLASTLMQTYNALSRGATPVPAVPEASYQDFVRWERDMLAGPEGQEHLAWWRQHLAGELPVLALRPDHPRPAVRGFHGATLSTSLDPTVSAQLKALARSQRVSLSTLLLSIYKILLHRYSGQEDIIVGMPTMGRPKQVFDRVMGCFINMLAVRSSVSGEQSFIDYLKTLQLTMMDSLDHAVYPFSELVRELQVNRDQSASPIFQTYYAYQNYVTTASTDSQPVVSQDALHTEFLTGIHQEGDKDLGLEVYEEPERFLINVKYNPELYEVTTMQRLLEHFTRLAAAVVQQPYGLIAAYDSFSTEQKTVMLRDWNDTARAFPTAQLLFQLFEEQAARTPDITAVVYKDQALTYAELDRRSSQLAAYLQQRGVGPETFVGLYMPRSLDIVVGAVGILKAGGVYVPLDPALPMERLAYMIEDAGAALLLTTAALAAQAQEFRSHIPDLELLCLDTDWPAMERSAVVWCPPALQPENLAYVIYTSGSTGRPKGVMIPHSTTTRHCACIREYFRITPGARVCLQSPISFDASIEQIFAPLSIGATVAIRDLEVLSPRPFSAMLTDLRVNVIQLPPAFIQALFREWQLHPGLIPPNLQLLISCGDVLAVETVRLWQSILKDRFTLLNVYGPTEVTAKATFHQIDPELDTTVLPRIPIGRPLANKRIYILDRYAYPTPLGVPGELHIGGTGPGRGYHGKPALTAEKFIPDPFSGAPDARLYKTGDLAYYHDDGTIEFLGRLDHQVKVRGHRIELGEIEAILAGHPGVKNAAVTTVDRHADKQIVAYVVPKDGYDFDQEDLKISLGRQLPEYMVPAAFVLLQQMPLTPSGKINRRGLPVPAGMQRHGTVAPRDAVEFELARLWAEVLEVQEPDVRQDFFALGGHSLLAIRLMVLIEERLGRDLPLSTLFQAPTIEQLAAILRQKDTRPVPALVTLQSLGTRPPFFCVPGAGGTVLYLNELAIHLGQDQPFHAFQARGLDGQSEPYTSVPQMAADYIRALLTIQPEGPYWLGGHSFGGRVAFEMARQLERQGQQVRQLVLLDCRAPQPTEPVYDWDETALLLAFAGALGLDIADHVDLLAGLVAESPLDDKLEHLLRALRHYNRILPDTRSAHFKGLFQVFRTSSQMQYVPDGPISAGITLFKATDFRPRVIDNEYFRQRLDDPAILTKIETMNRIWTQFNTDLLSTRQDPHLGWDCYTTGAVTAYEIPGDHMNIVKAPHVHALARAIRECLAN